MWGVMLDWNLMKSSSWCRERPMATIASRRSSTVSASEHPLRSHPLTTSIGRCGSE
jgi:hypothetical protein